MNKFFFVFIVLILNSIFLLAQVKSLQTTNFINAAYQYGYILQVSKFVKGENAKGEPIKWCQNIRFEYGTQTDGSEIWHQLYNLPRYGIGVYFGDFFNPEEIGYPTALYGFFKFPFARWERNSLHMGFGFGLSTDWKSFHPTDNPYNNAIGELRAFYIDVEFGYLLKISNKFDLIASVTGTHFSNGGSKQPNSGFNIISPMIKFKYNLNYILPKVQEVSIPEYINNHEWLIAISGGVKNILYIVPADDVNERYRSVDYFAGAITSEYLYQYDHKYKYGVGADISYDGSANNRTDSSEVRGYEIEASFIEKMSLGVFGKFELVIHNLSVNIALGYYIIRKEFPGEVPDFYQKLGFKYHLWDNYFTGLNIRFYEFMSADYIEWNVGYRIKF